MGPLISPVHRKKTHPHLPSSRPFPPESPTSRHQPPPDEASFEESCPPAGAVYNGPADQRTMISQQTILECYERACHKVRFIVLASLYRRNTFNTGDTTTVPRVQGLIRAAG